MDTHVCPLTLSINVYMSPCDYFQILHARMGDGGGGGVSLHNYSLIQKICLPAALIWQIKFYQNIFFICLFVGRFGCVA